jgi:hypothetical protein
MGDLNYRIDAAPMLRSSLAGAAEEGSPGAAAAESGAGASARDVVEAAITHGDAAALRCGDQLLRERAAGRVAHGFVEGPLRFRPT